MRLALLVATIIALAGCSSPSRYMNSEAWAICPGLDVEIVKVTETPEQIQAGFSAFKLAKDVHAAAYAIWLRGCVCEIHVPPPTIDHAEYLEAAERLHCFTGLYHD